jgi:BirA family biotin operon repressor/biotin-[acetyl-CoA-carboxylase] ligase
MKSKILELLQQAGNAYLSGQAMSETLGVSRAAVWKVIGQLREEGYQIEAVSRKGYRLVHRPDRLSPDCLAPYLTKDCPLGPITYFASTPSTNDEAKAIAWDAAEGTVVVADEQIKGRGRRGRNWHSPAYKNIYLSLILKPDIPMVQVPLFTQMAAAAVWEALSPDLAGLKIKWPNDLMVGSKKICGILTEMSGEMNAIHYLVIGIGINVNTDPSDFPDELSPIAASMKMESGHAHSRQQLTARVLDRLAQHYQTVQATGSFETALAVCRAQSNLLGTNINIHKAQGMESGHAIDIDPNGFLVVETASGEERLSSGEVSIRKK